MFQHQNLISILILFGAILLRGALLEYTDLIDPTEARYASVAQEMVLLGDWLTPRLPMPEGVVPYMGKPPLHFWLTASAYSIFGIDEWTARLPSWLSAIALLLVIVSFGRRFFGERVGLSAALIAFSSVILFFLSGASVTDVTLAALVTGSTYFLYLLAISDGLTRKYALISSACMALAFLTKGPIAVILVWLPLLLWSAVQKNFRWLKSVPWLTSGLLFFAITSPWFVANEINNPGSFRYFFWNENIARYLFKDYGDKYGTGHVHPYGTSWFMLFANFMPWSLIIIWKSFRRGWRQIWERLKSDQNLLFALTWGVSAALFFTFVRQLHGMYVLPCIPGMALFSAVLLEEKEGKHSLRTFEFLSDRRFAPVLSLILIGFIFAGAILEFSQTALILGLILAAAGVLILRELQPHYTQVSGIQRISYTLFLVYLIAIVCLTPYVDQRRSAGELLDDLADATIHQARIPQVGITSRNQFSFYWTAKAWKNELCRKLNVRYTEIGKIPKNIKHIIVRSTDAARLSERERASFAFVKQRGKWQLYSRRPKAHV